MSPVEMEKTCRSRVKAVRARANHRDPVDPLDKDVPELLHELAIRFDHRKSRAKHLPARLKTAHAKMQARYIAQLEVNCEECGGSGFDPGGVDPWGPEECPKCHGAKKQTITRNYLAEAFQIAANPESVRQVEREHLVAVIHHCRETVRAVMSLPEVARTRISRT